MENSMEIKRIKIGFLNIRKLDIIQCKRLIQIK